MTNEELPLNKVGKFGLIIEYLAGQLADYCKADNDWSCHDKTRDNCIRCKFEEARKAVKND